MIGIGTIVHTKLLGTFRHTGTFRAPMKGEYYACEIVPGVALAVRDWRSKRWILEKLP